MKCKREDKIVNNVCQDESPDTTKNIDSNSLRELKRLCENVILSEAKDLKIRKKWDDPQAGTPSLRSE